MNAKCPHLPGSLPQSTPTSETRSGVSGESPEPLLAAVVVDQLELFRLGVTEALRDCSVPVLTGLSSLSEGIRIAREHAASLLIVGTHPDLKRRNSLKVVIRDNPNLRLLVLLGQADLSDVARLVDAGVHGLLLRSAHVAEFREAIRRVQAGERFVASAIAVGTLGRIGPLDSSKAGDLLSESALTSENEPANPAEATTPSTQALEEAALRELLTAREVEVLGELAIGSTYAEIAEALIVTQATVKTHLVHIYAKLGVRNRSEAIARALELGYLG